MVVMATSAVMEALKESGMQHTAQYQLNYLDEFEAVHTEGDENIPQHIVELRLIRPYLLGVASGTIVWDAEEVTRSIKRGEEGTTPDKAPDSSDVEEDSENTTTAATVGTLPDRSAPTFVACGPLTKSPDKERGQVDNISTTQAVKAKHTMDFGERVAKIAKPRLSRVTMEAMSFLRSAPQSPLPESVSDVASPTGLAVVPSSEAHLEEDLISFDHDPVAIPNKNESSDVPNVNPFQDVLLDIDNQAQTEPSEWRIVLDRYPTLNLTTVKKEEVECFVCHKISTEPFTTCPCSHQYCSDCLCNLVKSSVSGAAAFPPTCCDNLVPIDINSAVFDEKTLREFLSKKFGNDHKTINGSPQDQKFDDELTQPSEEVLPALEKAKQGLCYLCYRVNEKDACKWCDSQSTLQEAD
ncbi:hypothetical protein NW768_004661 [Fusarium equiseti]|uniref:RING-type domain-containing protein n=1 Tax=Fusarium equiseti TaxID=61235 RepID=A0ABQ8RGX1_FUSEQ|nr:hypothetical protein NW768_004661 [Fusarium equiseti]